MSCIVDMVICQLATPSFSEPPFRFRICCACSEWPVCVRFSSEQRRHAHSSHNTHVHPRSPPCRPDSCAQVLETCRPKKDGGLLTKAQGDMMEVRSSVDSSTFTPTPMHPSFVHPAHHPAWHPQNLRLDSHTAPTPPTSGLHCRVICLVHATSTCLA